MTSTATPLPPGANRRNRSGFTLVEVLVSIAVVAVLTAILILGLRAAVGKASLTETEVHGRSYHQLHASWWADHNDTFVNVGQYDEGFRTRRELTNSDLVVYLDSLDGRLLHIAYAQQAAYPAWKAVVEKHTGERVPIDTPFAYGYAFFTDPELWRHRAGDAATLENILHSGGSGGAMTGDFPFSSPAIARAEASGAAPGAAVLIEGRSASGATVLLVVEFLHAEGIGWAPRRVTSVTPDGDGALFTPRM